MKILMVCLGNICRSPLAEGIMREKIILNGLDWEVDSAGTGSWHVGELPDPRSVSTARENGIDITNQRARQFRKSDLDEFDLIYVMDASNYRDVIQHCDDDQKQKVKMILNVLEPGMNRQVPDPYYNDGFDRVFEMLDKACEGIVEEYG